MTFNTSVVAFVSAVLLALTANVECLRADEPVKVALLGLEFKNDNEGLDPTSDAERARQIKTKDVFKSLLEASGRYKFVPVTDEVKTKMDAGQQVGTCLSDGLAVLHGVRDFFREVIEPHPGLLVCELLLANRSVGRRAGAPHLSRLADRVAGIAE